MPKGTPKNGINKGWIKKGQRLSPQTEFKNGDTPYNKGKPHLKDEAHPMWKGKDVKYAGIHMWINRKLERPKQCTNCPSERYIQWANISKEYKRDLDDWIDLCNSCHQKWDKGGKIPDVITKRS